MPTVINTNLASLFAQNSLSNAQNNLAQSVQRLSSGLRINSAKDDAAGLTIAQNMQSQINGVNQSIRNLSDATNLIQTAESSLATIQDMLLRMKQLSTQGYNGSLSTTQKNALVNELTDLNSEINATAVRTKFNGVGLLATGQSIDSNTGDVFKGQYLTAVGVSISSTGDLDQTGKYSLSSSPPAISATGSSTYTIETDNDVFKRNMVGTYTFSSYDDTLTLTYQDADTGKISQQSLTVNDALHDPVVAKTTEQELDFSDFGIKLNLSNTVAAGAEDSLGANIAAVFDTKTIIYTGQSSQITDISLSGTQSATYSFTNTSVAEVATVTFANDLDDDNESVTIAGLTVKLTNSHGAADTVTATEIAAAFAGRKDGDVVDLELTSADGGIYTVTGTLTGYNTGTNALGVLAFTSTRGGTDPTALTAAVVGVAAITPAISTAATVSSVLTLSYTDNAGVAHTENLTLEDADFTKGSDTIISFGDAGVSLKIHNFQTQTAAEIAYQISRLYGKDGGVGTEGQLKVLQSATSNLAFQSGPSTEAYIDIKTLNVMTGSNGVTEGSVDEMIAVGSYITSNLADLDSSNTDPEWQAVFSSLGAAIDNAIDYISTERAIYGSQVNRLSFMTTNLQANSTNLQNSRSSIIDTDFAAETAALTKGQIMQQAATAMLAQANQMPNVILSLLK